jgi:DNA repair exonuclease SbcCD ATPase subunit
MLAVIALEQGSETATAHLQQVVTDMVAAERAARDAERSAHTKLVQAETELAHSQSLLSSHTETFGDISSLSAGVVCHVCKQPVAEAHKAAVHAAHEAQLKQLSANVWQCQEAFDKHQLELEKNHKHLVAVSKHRAQSQATLSVCCLLCCLPLLHMFTIVSSNAGTVNSVCGRIWVILASLDRPLHCTAGQTR